MALLSVQGLSKTFAPPGRPRFAAVADIDLELEAGQCLGLIGESGSGKSTLLKCLARFLEPETGRIQLDGRDWRGLAGREWRRCRRQMQVVFQDAAAAFDPRLTIGASLSAALETPDSSAVLAELERVGLSPDLARRLPHQLSGGQLQRANLARALLARPRVLLLDEPVSALDPELRTAVLDLLGRLRDLGLALIVVGHDLEAIGRVADRLAVLYLSRIVETGRASTLLTRPGHPYTAALLAAVPRLGAKLAVAAPGEIPAPWQPPSGCAFHPRCASAQALCRGTPPPLVPLADGALACYRPLGTDDA